MKSMVLMVLMVTMVACKKEAVENSTTHSVVSYANQEAFDELNDWYKSDWLSIRSSRRLEPESLIETDLDMSSISEPSVANLIIKMMEELKYYNFEVVEFNPQYYLEADNYTVKLYNSSDDYEYIFIKCLSGFSFVTVNNELGGTNEECEEQIEIRKRTVEQELFGE